MEKKIEKMTKAELLDLLNHKEEVLQEKIKQIEDLEEKLEDVFPVLACDDFSVTVNTDDYRLLVL